MRDPLCLHCWLRAAILAYCGRADIGILPPEILARAVGVTLRGSFEVNGFSGGRRDAALIWFLSAAVDACRDRPGDGAVH